MGAGLLCSWAGVQHQEGGRLLLGRITEAFIQRFATLKRTVPKLLALITVPNDAARVYQHCLIYMSRTMQRNCVAKLVS